jgi:hypothetical protein
LKLELDPLADMAAGKGWGPAASRAGLFWNLLGGPGFFLSAFSFSNFVSFFFIASMLNTDCSWQASTHLMTDLYALLSRLFASTWDKRWDNLEFAGLITITIKQGHASQTEFKKLISQSSLSD